RSRHPIVRCSCPAQPDRRCPGNLSVGNWSPSRTTRAAGGLAPAAGGGSSLPLAGELPLPSAVRAGIHLAAAVALDLGSQCAYLLGRPGSVTSGEQKRFEATYHRVCSQRED